MELDFWKVNRFAFMSTLKERIIVYNIHTNNNVLPIVLLNGEEGWGERKGGERGKVISNGDERI